MEQLLNGLTLYSDRHLLLNYLNHELQRLPSGSQHHVVFKLQKAILSSTLLPSSPNFSQELVDAKLAGITDKRSIEYAQMLYECGKYEESAAILEPLSINRSGSDEVPLTYLWGFLASLLLSGQAEKSLFVFHKLRERVDTAYYSSETEALNARLWVLHTSLWVFFHSTNCTVSNLTAFADLCLIPAYQQAIEIKGQHLLPFLTIVTVLHRRKKGLLKETIRITSLESAKLSSPICLFLDALTLQFDYEGAQAKLQESAALMMTHYFMSRIVNDFMEAAVVLIFESICRVRCTMSFDRLTAFLGIGNGGSSGGNVAFVENLIKTCKIDAKVDNGLLVINHTYTSVECIINDRIRQLSARVK